MVENIKCLCRKEGITFAELERTVGLGNGTIARWDENSPSIVRVKAVADYFGVTVDQLIGGDSSGHSGTKT